MRLSKLQKHILLKCFEAGPKPLPKTEFYAFYSSAEVKNNLNSVQIRMHNSIENMVDKDWVVVHGHKTALKFYIDSVRLSAKGKRLAKEIIQKKQRRLPIK